MADVIDLSNKTVWLIGASEGIGRELALLIANENPKKLILSSRTEASLKDLCDEMRSAAVSYKAFDISVQDAVSNASREIKQQFGEIDILIINSGIYEITYVDNFSAKDYEQITKVNYIGALYATEQVLPEMLKKSFGVIVAVSSIAGVRPIPGGGAYGASKAALTYFFEALRMQVQARGVRIILVHPGFVKTRLTAKNTFTMPGLMTARDAAVRIVEGIKKGKDEISFPWWFVNLIRLLRLLPEPIYRKIVISMNNEHESKGSTT